MRALQRGGERQRRRGEALHFAVHVRRELISARGTRAAQRGEMPAGDARRHGGEHAGDVLVAQHAAHRDGLRRVTRGEQIVRQDFGCLGVVRDVENDLRPPGQHLEARRQRDLCQAAAHCLHLERQLLAQAIERAHGRGGVTQLHRAAQRRMREAAAFPRRGR